MLHESESLLLDSSKANQRLGWKNVFSIDQALSETIEWYKTYHENNKDMKQFTDGSDKKLHIFSTRK